MDAAANIQANGASKTSKLYESPVTGALKCARDLQDAGSEFTRKGMYRMAKWLRKDAASATSSHGFRHGGMVSNELSCRARGPMSAMPDTRCVDKTELPQSQWQP